MTRWIGAAIPLLALMFGSSVAIVAATAAPLQAAVQTPATRTPTDLSARRHVRHHLRHTYRPHDELYYYDRPYTYEPAPFVPFNYGYIFWPRIFWWP